MFFHIQRLQPAKTTLHDLTRWWLPIGNEFAERLIGHGGIRSLIRASAQALPAIDLPEGGGKITHACDRRRHLHQPIRHHAAAGGD